MCAANAGEPEERTPQLNISLRSRRRRTVVGGAVLALALGGLAAALPAEASAGQSASTGIGAATATATATSTSIPITGGSPPEGGGGPLPSFVGTITDSLNPGGLTAPDAILTCATSQIAIGGTYAITVPKGCLTLYNGEWVKVTWTGLNSTGVSTELSLGTDGNLVLTPGDSVTPWSSGTTFKGNLLGPGCLAQFTSSADDLVVDNCDGTSIWNSGAHTYGGAILAFQSDGNLVVYESSAGTALWSSKT